MKKAIILTLVGVNLTLLVSLALVSEPPKAYGQSIKGGTDYLMVTGHLRTSYDILYLVDTGKRKMVGLVVDQTSQKITPHGGRRLTVDFQAERR